MNQINPCDISRDLMPLSIDGVCSEGSQRFLDDHLAKCPPCYGMYERMKSTPIPVMTVVPEREEQALRQSLRYLGQRFRVLWIALAVMAAALVLLLSIGGIQRMMWLRSSTAPLDSYTVTMYRQDAMFCMNLSATFPKQTYNGPICDEKIVTGAENHTDAEKAIVLTYSVSYFPQQAKAFIEAMPTEASRGFTTREQGFVSNPAADFRYNGELLSHKMCVMDGNLYLIDLYEGLMTTYGRPLMLLTPGLPVSEIRLTDGKNTITLYTWGDEIPNHSINRVDEYGLPQSGMISPSDYERFRDVIE